MNLFKIALLCGWLLFTLGAFAYFSLDRLIEFDANGRLDNKTLASFSETIKHDYNLNFIGKGAVVHFQQPDCACNQASKIHAQALDVIAKQHQLEVAEKAVNKGVDIPSTPSVAIFNKSGKLIYFGPYGEGLGCSQTQGFASTVLNNMLKGYDAELLVKNARGCYCAI